MGNRHLVSGLTCALWVGGWAAAGSKGGPAPGAPGPLLSSASTTQTRADRLGWSAPEWTIDPSTGRGRRWNGRSEPPTTVAILDDDYAKLAAGYLAEAADVLGISPAELHSSRVSYLPLGLTGSTDKVAVLFKQRVRGVPVSRAAVQVVLGSDGRLLSLSSTAVPDLGSFVIAPVQTATNVAGLARAEFLRREGVASRITDPPRLIISGVDSGNLRVPTLAWEVHLRDEGEDFPEFAAAVVIADLSGAVLEYRDEITNFDVSGTVRSWVTPGVGPDNVGSPEANAEVEENVSGVTVTSAQGNTVTRRNGTFTIVGANATSGQPLDVTVQFKGKYADVVNAQGTDYSMTVPLTQNSGNVIVMNSERTEYTTGQANAYHWINLVREYIRTVNPTDATFDYDLGGSYSPQKTAIVNRSSGLLCNAFYLNEILRFEGVENCQPIPNPPVSQTGNPCSIYAGGQCTNKANATVIAHELGHLLNRLYISTLTESSFDEGLADVWAFYVSGQPTFGPNWCQNVDCMRTGLNTAQFCGDTTPDCLDGGASHVNGQVLMGALWKVRASLESTYGSTTGPAIADALFNAWILSTTTDTIHSVIQTEWLILDDDDGNLLNGTPHSTDIEAGFQAQGFP